MPKPLSPPWTIALNFCHESPINLFQGWLTQFTSHSPGIWKPEIKVSAGLVPPEVSLLGLYTVTFSLCPHMVFSSFLHTTSVSHCGANGRISRIPHLTVAIYLSIGVSCCSLPQPTGQGAETKQPFSPPLCSRYVIGLASASHRRPTHGVPPGRGRQQSTAARV